MPRTVWIKLGEIDSSSSPGDYHIVKKNPVNGEIGCDCGAYRFFYAHGRHAADEERTCKHIVRFQAENPETIDMDITSAEAWMNLWLTQKNTYHRRWSREWFDNERDAMQRFNGEAVFITPYGNQWTVFVPIRSLTMANFTITVSEREFHWILAGLRSLTEVIWPLDFPIPVEDIRQIATNDGEYTIPIPAELDELCQRLNITGE